MTQVHKVYNLTLEGPPANPDYVSCTGLPNCLPAKFPITCLRQIKSREPLSVQVEVPSDESAHGFHKLAGKTVILQNH